MGKALSGELSCPCDRSCYDFLFASLDDTELSKLIYSVRKEFAPMGANSFISELNSIEKGEILKLTEFLTLRVYQFILNDFTL